MGKTTALNQLRAVTRGNFYGHFEYISKVLNVPYNRLTYWFILHPFLYVIFAIGGVYFHCWTFFFKAAKCIMGKKRPYPFIIKLKLINNLVRTLGAYCFLNFYGAKHKNKDIVIIDEGVIQLVNNIIISFDKTINTKTWDKLLAALPNQFLTKACLFRASLNVTTQRCLERKDPAFGKKKLTRTQWYMFAINSEKSFDYLQSLKVLDLFVVPIDDPIKTKQILTFIK